MNKEVTLESLTDRDFKIEARDFKHKVIKSKNLNNKPITSFKLATGFAFELLADLNPKLTYHNRDHTHRDVVPSIMEFSLRENLSIEEIKELVIAGWYHDLGYLIQNERNEPIGAKIAEITLPIFGYDSKMIKSVEEEILVTYLEAKPKNEKQEIICDADLGNLGLPYEEFFKRSMALKEELENYGFLPKRSDERKWFIKTYKLFKDHKYHTQSARELRQAQKDENFKRLKLEYIDQN